MGKQHEEVSEEVAQEGIPPDKQRLVLAGELFEDMGDMLPGRQALHFAGKQLEEVMKGGTPPDKQRLTNAGEQLEDGADKQHVTLPAELVRFLTPSRYTARRGRMGRRRLWMRRWTRR